MIVVRLKERSNGTRGFSYGSLESCAFRCSVLTEPP